jgi:hypothetical protein
MTETIATIRRAQRLAKKEALKQGKRIVEVTKSTPMAYEVKAEIAENRTESDTFTDLSSPKPPKEEIKTEGQVQGEKEVKAIIQAPPEQPQAIHRVPERKEDSQSTKDKKKLFLGIYRRLLCSVKSTCEKADIVRSTFYEWMKDDPEFVKGVNQAYQEKLEDVVELESKKMMAGDGAMIRHFLDRRHPDYMPRVKVEGPRPGEVAGEDHVRDYFNNNGNQNKPGLHPGQLPDPGQTGNAGAVHAESGPAVLLGPEDKKEPDIKSPAEGHQ